MLAIMFKATELCIIQRGNDWLLTSDYLTCAVSDSSVPSRPPEDIGGPLTSPR